MTKISLVNGRIHVIFDTQECIQRYNSYCSQDGYNNMILNTKTVGYDLKACEYYVGRTTCSYSDGHQASSTILDITDTVNGKYLYYQLTGDTNAVFTEKPNVSSK